MGHTNRNNPDNFNWLPERIGNFKIHSILGMGGMGVIYKATQEPLNRQVALKVLLPSTAHGEEATKRFELEAKAISMLQHQNIVSLYEFGRDGEYLYFAMQYVDGEDLGKKVARKKHMPYGEVIDIAKQICRGLRYAHEKNIAHRDIKPQNILLDKEGKVLISDFGIARIFSNTHITLTGVAVGTPEYMSPEQAEGKEPDAQTDVYSLGIVLYEMVTHQPPFTGENAVAIAYKQVHELPVPPSVRRKDIPKRLELIILKALKKDKNERYGTALEMLDHLDSVDIDEKVEKPTVSFKRQPDTKAGSALLDKRITDRRSGDRRHGYHLEDLKLFSGRFWMSIMETQGLSLALVVVLAIVLLLHLLRHP
jgi:serine/threonine-protein kinase